MDAEERAMTLGVIMNKLDVMHDDILEGKAKASKHDSRLSSLEHFRTWVKGGAALLTAGLALAAKAKGLF